MKEISFELGEFPKGYFLCWEVSTQTPKAVNVRLTVGNTTYFNVSKNKGTNNFQLLNLNSRDHNVSETPILTVGVSDSTRLQKSSVTGAINDPVERKVGYVYTICIEDADDNDFNDVYINIVGWARKN
ncbi:MAG: hypothetical protein FWC91_02855 [Defluviitaleaceae bacterium]|nr:hypothetical protein [Defluviitaleaceae bacterium]